MHGADDLVLGSILEDVPRGPCLERLEKVVGVFVHRHHQDANLGVSLLDLPRRGEAIHLGHPHVHQHQVGAQA
jgi:hypothetical protein